MSVAISGRSSRQMAEPIGEAGLTESRYNCPGGRKAAESQASRGTTRAVPKDYDNNKSFPSSKVSEYRNLVMSCGRRTVDKFQRELFNPLSLHPELRAARYVRSSAFRLQDLPLMSRSTYLVRAHHESRHIRFERTRSPAAVLILLIHMEEMHLPRN